MNLRPILLIIEMAKIEINRRLYWIYANCRDKIESTGGNIKIMLIIDYQNEINRNYANYRDGQNRINRRPYWIYYIYIDYQIGINRRPYWIYYIYIDKLELTGGLIGLY